MHRGTTDAGHGAGRRASRQEDGNHRQQPSVPCPLDKVSREFRAPQPNALWVSDFTYVATWGGFVYVAFVIDAFARRIVGWKVSRSATADFVLDALEQALHPAARQGSLIHHSDRGSQYLAMNYTQRLAEADRCPRSAASETAMTMPWPRRSTASTRPRSSAGAFPGAPSAVEMATLRWVDWFNNHRLFEPIGNIPPAEAEAAYYAQLETIDSRVDPN